MSEKIGNLYQVECGACRWRSEVVESLAELLVQYGHHSGMFHPCRSDDKDTSRRWLGIPRVTEFVPVERQIQLHLRGDVARGR